MLFWALAFDHRNSFRTEFLGSADAGRIRALKSVILEGLLSAVADGLPEGRAVALVEDEYGSDAAIRARDSGIIVALAVEESGRDEFAFAHTPFQAGLERLDPDFAKALVRYNPDSESAMNGRQREKLLELQAWVAGHGKELMLEVLVPPTPAQLESVGGDRARYDRLLRPSLTVRGVRELAGEGLAPRLWKLEGMGSSDEYAAVAAEIRSDAGCLVLGRGEDRDAVERWLALAAPVPGFMGFAVGRTLWWDPLKAMLEGSIDEGEAAAGIGRNYRELIGVYLAARRAGTPGAS
jgi:myo-inositol catabolism protein IolC